MVLERQEKYNLKKRKDMGFENCFITSLMPLAERLIIKMKYRYCAYNAEHYATGLRRESVSGHLKWDSPARQDAIIVETLFGVDPTEKMNVICEKLDKVQLQPERFNDIGDNIAVRKVTYVEKAQKNGCEIDMEARTYTLFACTQVGDEIEVYAPRMQAMRTHSRDIPMEIKIDIYPSEREVVRFVFQRRVEQTGFYVFDFSKVEENTISSYRDGSLVYRVGESIVIPITRQMILSKKIYVKTKIKPIIESKSEGITLMEE